MRKILVRDLPAMAERITGARMVPIDEELAQFTLEIEFSKTSKSVVCLQRGGLRIMNPKAAFKLVRNMLGAKQVMVSLVAGGKEK